MKKIGVILSSLTGNTETFIDYVNENYDVLIYKWSIEELSKYNHEYLYGILNQYDGLMIGSYTWGNGVVPKEMKDFLLYYKNAIPKDKVLLFGSGITLYTFFCGAVDKMEKMILPRKREVPKIKFELTFEPEENKENIELLNDFLNKI